MRDISNLRTLETHPATRIGDAISVAERSSRIAMRDNALLVAALVSGGMDLALPIETECEATARALEGLTLLGEHRRVQVAMHRRTKAIARKANIEENMWGDCEPSAVNRPAALAVAEAA